MCHAAGQRKSTPILLALRPGDWNALHRDLYGDLVFPLQVVINLSQPGVDHTGGEFLLYEQRPRAQSRGHRHADPARPRLRVHAPATARCESARGWSAAPVRHGVSVIRSGQRFTPRARLPRRRLMPGVAWLPGVHAARPPTGALYPARRPGSSAGTAREDLRAAGLPAARYARSPSAAMWPPRLLRRRTGRHRRWLPALRRLPARRPTRPGGRARRAGRPRPAPRPRPQRRGAK